MLGSDQHRVPDTVSDQFKTPENEGAHDDLAELNVGLYELLQSMTIKLDHLTRLAHSTAHERTTTGEHVEFSGKASRSMSGDQHIALRIRLDDFDLSGNNNEEARPHLTLLDQQVAGTDWIPLPCSGNSSDLRRRKRRKQLFA